MLQRVVLMLTISFIPFIQALGAQYNLRKFGVRSGNSPEVNTVRLQKAIDKVSEQGGILYVEPVEGGYPIKSGIVLKKNVSLVGVHGPTGRGTVISDSEKKPTGSLFVITDSENPVFTVESATRIEGCQFYYPEQAWNDPSKIIEYPPTIAMSQNQPVQGVTLRNLTFYGEYLAMDFRAVKPQICEQILIEHCYGYPLSGQFVAIDRCYDIPRLLHLHVNPANMRLFGKSYSWKIVDAVVSKGNYTFWIDHTDNAQMMDLFTFGNFGGVYLGPNTYGQLTNFNFDCVTVGIYKYGGNSSNRNWQIAQGSIIANTGKGIKDIHPIVITGEGHTSIVSVEAFSGQNGALSTIGESYDYLYVTGDKPLTVSVVGCRMQGYQAKNPFTVLNGKAKVKSANCLNKEGNFF